MKRCDPNMTTEPASAAPIPYGGRPCPSHWFPPKTRQDCGRGLRVKKGAACTDGGSRRVGSHRDGSASRGGSGASAETRKGGSLERGGSG